MCIYVSDTVYFPELTLGVRLVSKKSHVDHKKGVCMLAEKHFVVIHEHLWVILGEAPTDVLEELQVLLQKPLRSKAFQSLNRLYVYFFLG